MPIVIGNYRWRQSLAPSEPEYASIEKQLQQSPSIAVPTITIDGKYDPFTPAGDGSSYRDHFTGKYEHRAFNVGHNVPQEAPRAYSFTRQAGHAFCCLTLRDISADIPNTR